METPTGAYTAAAAAVPIPLDPPGMTGLTPRAFGQGAHHRVYRVHPQQDREHHLNEDTSRWRYREWTRRCWSVP